MLPESDQIIPSYFLLREIGEGGMGTVYSARHRSEDYARKQGEVAIKVLDRKQAKRPDICERFKIESVPAFLFFHKCMLTESVTGANVSELVLKTKQNALTSAIHTNMVHVAAAVQPTPDQEPLEERLQALTKREPVMLFMKGDPEEPRCGFSRKIVELLQTAKVKFDTFDILSDEDVRQGLKKFSNFPTFPQLYADGKLVGGLDIVKEMHEDGELLEALPSSAVG